MSTTLQSKPLASDRREKLDQFFALLELEREELRMDKLPDEPQTVMHSERVVDRAPAFERNALSLIGGHLSAFAMANVFKAQRT